MQWRHYGAHTRQAEQVFSREKRNHRERGSERKEKRRATGAHTAARLQQRSRRSQANERANERRLPLATHTMDGQLLHTILHYSTLAYRTQSVPFRDAAHLQVNLAVQVVQDDVPIFHLASSVLDRMHGRDRQCHSRRRRRRCRQIGRDLAHGCAMTIDSQMHRLRLLTFGWEHDRALTLVAHNRASGKRRD